MMALDKAPGERQAQCRLDAKRRGYPHSHLSTSQAGRHPRNNNERVSGAANYTWPVLCSQGRTLRMCNTSRFLAERHLR